MTATLLITTAWVVKSASFTLTSSRRAEQCWGEGEAHYILQTDKAEAEKVRLMGVAYKEQVNALGPQGVALVETLKVNGDGAGNLGTLLLLNLFRDQMKVGQNGSTANGQANTSAKQW